MRGDGQLNQSQPTIEAVELDLLLFDPNYNHMSMRPVRLAGEWLGPKRANLIELVIDRLGKLQ
jgi:hypothetical protein